MRRWTHLVATGLVSLLFASQAAWSLPYTGTLELVIGTLPPIVVPGAGDGVSTTTAVEIGPGANLTTTVVIPVINQTNLTFPAFPIVDLGLTGPAGLTAANFAAGAAPGGGLGGDAGLVGNSKIGLFGPPPFAFITVPLSPVGVAGAKVTVSENVFIVVEGSGWTTGVARVLGEAGNVLGQATGTDARTPGGAGTVVLVTPTLVKTNIAASAELPLIGTLTLNFVPEPGTALMLGSGIAGLALLARRRTYA